MKPSRVSSEISIDHIGLLAKDIAALRETYLRLGFTVTRAVPFMQPSPDGKGEVALGHVSARVVLGETYLELTSVRHPGQGSLLDRWLERGEGLHVLSFRSDDAARSMKDLIDAGLVMPPLRNASHRAYQLNGETARYKWFELPDSVAREGLATVIEHLTPDLVFVPAMAGHTNGATNLSKVFAIVEDMDEAFARYSRLPGTQQTSFVVGRTIAMHNQQFVVVEPKGFAALFPGAAAPPAPSLGAYALSVDDLAVTRDVLEKAAVPYRPWGQDGIWVAPEHAGGAVLVFTGPASA